MATHSETYNEAVRADKEAGKIENSLPLPDKVDKEAYLFEIAAYTLMRSAYEILLHVKQEVDH